MFIFSPLFKGNECIHNGGGGGGGAVEEGGKMGVGGDVVVDSILFRPSSDRFFVCFSNPEPVSSYSPDRASLE